MGKSGGEYGGRRKDVQWSGVLVGGVDLRFEDRLFCRTFRLKLYKTGEETFHRR